VIASSNPLLRHGQIPQFQTITADHVEPAIRQLIATQDTAFTALQATATPTWEGLIEPLRRLSEPLGFAWGVVNHLLGVRNEPALRAAHECVQADVVAAAMRLGQSARIHSLLLALQATGDLDVVQQRVLAGLIRDGEWSGIALTGAARERFNALAVEQSELATCFQNHLLDATRSFALEFTDLAEVAGLPDTARAQAAAAARAAGNAAATAEKGPWRITLEMPLFVPFMEHATRRDLREQLYRAFITRASSGPHDNSPLITRVLAARREQAQLLGYTDFAAQSLSGKMAGTVATVDSLLAVLRKSALPAARREWQELQDFARGESRDPGLQLRHWDVAFWAERQRESRYAYSEEALRPYFPFDRVLDGLFELVHTLFGVTVRPAQAETWHPDVRFFEVLDQGKVIAGFFLDVFSRPAEKRGGAWMDVCLDRCRDARGERLPIAYLVCNQAAPVDGKPSLMSFGEVETLFHEFGHGLQHLLTRIDHPEVAGINRIEWDAVELPSQFMENWCFHRETVRGLSRHIDTGASLPDELFDKIVAARAYRAGSQFMRQIALASVDLALHQLADPEQFSATVQRIWAENSVLPPLPEDRFLCSFSHIFAGGYGAGYYSYKWAEVLSADAFAAFLEGGVDDRAAMTTIGRRFRETVLALGGGTHPAEVFREFRGRDPAPQALLETFGLVVVN